MATYAAVLMRYRETTGVTEMSPNRAIEATTTVMPLGIGIDMSDYDAALANVTNTKWTPNFYQF